MNVVLAIIVLCSMGMITGAPQEQSTQVLQVLPNQEAARVGLRTGDWVLAIDGVPMKNGTQMIGVIQSKPGQPITLTIRRGTEILPPITVTPRPEEAIRNGKKVMVGKLGFMPGATFKRLRFRESVQAGFSTFAGFFYMLHDIIKAGKLKESVGGPAAMLRASNMNAKLDPAYQYSMVGQLSISLAVFNLLPIPVLDGGHLAILLVEVLRRRRLGPEAHRVATAMGLVFIGVLFVFLMYSDVSKWVANKMMQ
jgi:regulator of sigma E protease